MYGQRSPVYGVKILKKWYYETHQCDISLSIEHIIVTLALFVEHIKVTLALFIESYMSLNIGYISCLVFVFVSGGHVEFCHSFMFLYL